MKRRPLRRLFRKIVKALKYTKIRPIARKIDPKKDPGYFHRTDGRKGY